MRRPALGHEDFSARRYEKRDDVKSYLDSIVDSNYERASSSLFLVIPQTHCR
ncbi:MAG: hypothetical protein ACI915_000491 [Gammaproteobacteria bacterium]|jgi:hypothetical protein